MATLHEAINETIDKIQSGEELTGQHYLLALAGLSQLYVNENQRLGFPVDNDRAYYQLQTCWYNLQSFPFDEVKAAKKLFE